jgi:hypothetical protein
MYGFKSSGNFDTCEQCAIAKAWQKNLNKNWLGSSNLPGESLYVGISSIKERSIGGAKFWALIKKSIAGVLRQRIWSQGKDQDFINWFKHCKSDCKIH